MSNRMMSILFACVCLMAGTQSLWGQNGSHGFRGYLDPLNRVVVALPEAQTSMEEPATSPFGGTINFNFTITVKANITSTAKIQCTGMATVLDLSAQNEILEQASVLATRSGTTATCAVTIPYLWNLASGTTDKLTLGYIISAPSEAALTASLPSRNSEQLAFATISIPANGSTTTETLTPTF